MIQTIQIVSDDVIINMTSLLSMMRISYPGYEIYKLDTHNYKINNIRFSIHTRQVNKTFESTLITRTKI